MTVANLSLRSARGIGLVIGSLVVVLIAADVAIVVAVWSVALVTWSTFAGMRLARWCGVGDERPLDVVALGYALGLFMTLVVDQVAVSGLGIVWRWTFPVVLAPLALVELLGVVRRSWGARVDPIVPLVVAGGALLAVGHEWLWSLPLGGAALATAWLVYERRSGGWLIGQWTLLLVSGLGTGVAVLRRDGRWWLTQNDTHFYEALAASVGRWGVDDFMLAAGRSLRYHWFPYAWVGAVDRAAGAGDYEVLTRVAPIVATGGILVCVVAIALRYVTVSQLGAVVVVFTVSPVFGDWWRGIPLAMAGSFSQLFAMAWLFAVPLALVGWLERPRAGRLVALGALMLALVGGKATHAVIAAVVLAATWLTLAWCRDPRARAFLAGGVAVVIAMAMLARWLFRDAMPLRFFPTDWLPYVQGDLYDWRGVPRLAATVAYLCGFVAIPTVAAFATRRGTVARLASGVALAVLVSAVLLSTLTNRLYNLQPNGLFAVHSAVSLVWVGVVIGAVRVRRTITWPSWVIPAAVGLGVLAVIPDLDSGAPIAVWLRVARAPVVLVPTLVVCVVALARRRPLRELLGPSLVASVALMLAVQAWMVAEELPAVDRAWRNASSDAPSTETAVASWLRTRTPPETVLGTNHLCATPACPQPEYSGDAAFAVAAGRRFVVAAPLFALSYSAESGTWRGRDRVAISIEFGRAPTTALAAALREAGVGWFVAERARSGTVDWAAVGDVRFENADYLVIELRDP